MTLACHVFVLCARVSRPRPYHAHRHEFLSRTCVMRQKHYNKMLRQQLYIAGRAGGGPICGGLRRSGVRPQVLRRTRGFQHGGLPPLCMWQYPPSFQSRLHGCSTAVLSLPGPRFMPRVGFVRDCGSDRHGNPLPPCIVMEKGESLQEWCNRADLDVFASVAVRPTALGSKAPEPEP